MPFTPITLHPQYSFGGSTHGVMTTTSSPNSAKFSINLKNRFFIPLTCVNGEGSTKIATFLFVDTGGNLLADFSAFSPRMRFRRSVIACIGSFKLSLRAAEEAEVDAVATLAFCLFWRRCNCSPRNDDAEQKISSPLGKKEEYKIIDDVFFLLVVAIPLPFVCLEEDEDEEEEEIERRSASETAPTPLLLPLLLRTADCRNNISLVLKNGIKWKKKKKKKSFC